MKKVVIASFFAFLMLMVPFTAVSQTSNINNVNTEPLGTGEVPIILITKDQNNDIINFIEGNFDEENKEAAYNIKNLIIQPYSGDYYKVNVEELADAWATYSYQPIPQSEIDDIPYGNIELLRDLVNMKWAANLFGVLVLSITNLIKNRLGWLHYTINKGYQLCVEGVFLALDFALDSYEAFLHLLDAVNTFLRIPEVFSNAMDYLFSQQFNKFINEILAFTGEFVAVMGILLIDLLIFFENVADFATFLNHIGEFIDYYIPTGGDTFPWRKKVVVQGIVTNFFIPVAGATVTCRDQTTTTDAAGSFYFEFTPSNEWGDSFPPNQYIGFHNFQLTVEKDEEYYKQTPTVISFAASYGQVNWPFLFFKSRSKSSGFRTILLDRVSILLARLQVLLPNLYNRLIDRVPLKA